MSKTLPRRNRDTAPAGGKVTNAQVRRTMRDADASFEARPVAGPIASSAAVGGASARGSAAMIARAGRSK